MANFVEALLGVGGKKVLLPAWANPTDFFADESNWVTVPPSTTSQGIEGSTNVRGVALYYKTDDAVEMGVRFHVRGSTAVRQYLLSGVPAIKAKAFLTATSMGSYYYHNLRPYVSRSP